jgi:glycosyltransferase involved in cell wall biosynthesis
VLKASIVITSFNQRKFIGQAIDSALSQKGTDVEVIVVDDGSTDGSQEFISSNFGSTVKLIEQKNKGPSCAANSGLEASSEQFIALLGGDDVCHPDRLVKQLDYLQSDQKDLVFCTPEIIDSDGEKLADSDFPVFSRIVNQEDFLKSLLREGNFLCAPSVVFRKEVVDKIGNFKAGLVHLQDYEYWIRCLISGFKIGRIEEKLISYRRHDANLSGSNTSSSKVEEAEIFDSLINNIAAQSSLRVIFGDILVPCSNLNSPLTELDKVLLTMANSNPHMKFLGAMRAIRMYENLEFRDLIYRVGISFPVLLKNSFAEENFNNIKK